MLARAFSKPSLARSARFFMASCWPALATTSFIVSWRISACRRTRRCQPSKAILFASARASMFDAWKSELPHKFGEVKKRRLASGALFGLFAVVGHGALFRRLAILGYGTLFRRFAV